MDPLTKQALNSLSCPVCKSPIDMLPKTGPKGFSFGCALDIDHYVLGMTFGLISIERVGIYDLDKRRKYIITKKHKDGASDTEISIMDTDQEGRIIFSFTDNKVTTDLEIFDFKRFNAEKAINKIKTFLLFR